MVAEESKSRVTWLLNYSINLAIVIMTYIRSMGDFIFTSKGESGREKAKGFFERKKVNLRE